MFRIVDSAGKVLAESESAEDLDVHKSDTFRVGPHYLQASFSDDTAVGLVQGWQDVAAYTHATGWVVK